MVSLQSAVARLGLRGPDLDKAVARAGDDVAVMGV
jgi:hypothetical protein